MTALHGIRDAPNETIFQRRQRRQVGLDGRQWRVVGFGAHQFAQARAIRRRWVGHFLKQQPIVRDRGAHFDELEIVVDHFVAFGEDGEHTVAGREIVNDAGRSGCCRAKVDGADYEGDKDVWYAT